jgi:hypothetical protein
MADDIKGPIGIYLTNPPARKSDPSWQAYFTKYIVPGLLILGTLRLLAWLLAWFA